MKEHPCGASACGGKLFFKLLDGSTVLCTCMGEPFVSRIVAACRNAQSAEINEAAHNRIMDYDTREDAGEDMSGEIRPRMPGGSDF